MLKVGLILVFFGRMKVGLVFGFCGCHFIGIGLVLVCHFPESGISSCDVTPVRDRFQPGGKRNAVIRKIDGISQFFFLDVFAVWGYR